MSEVKVDTISERTAAGGVTIDGVLIKDGVATFQTPAGSPLVFEGATANAFETTFAITDPTADRTITFPDSSFTVPTSGGLTTASQWRLTTSFDASVAPIASNLEEVDAPVGFGILGSSMTESSGIFTFPSTGYWYITFQHDFYGYVNVWDWATFCLIETTTNNSTYASAADGVSSTGQHNPYNVNGSSSASYIFDVTDTSNCKVRFSIGTAVASTTTLGSTAYLRTGMTFIKLADT